MAPLKYIVSTLFVILSVALMVQAQGTVQVDGKPYTIHKVNSGETFFSIAMKYDVVIDSIKRVNRLDSLATIRPGDLLIIPTFASRKPDPGQVEPVVKSPSNYLIHIVKTGETLYSIGREYTHTTVSEIKKINKLESDTVKIGQQLFIPKPGDSGYAPIPGKNEPVSGSSVIGQAIDSAALFDPGSFTKLDTTSTVDDIIDQSTVVTVNYDAEMLAELKSLYLAEDSLIQKRETERGAAIWLNDPSRQNHYKFFALSNTIPDGSVVMVRNLMNNKEVYVKVIGKLPPMSQGKNVIIQLSAGAANYLKVLDDKFLVEVTSHPAKS